MQPRRLLPVVFLALVALLGVAAPGCSADTYSVGRTVAPFSAKDQFGAAFQLGPETRALLISFDMATGRKANAKLSALGKEFLPQRHAVYVANIEGMPAMGRMFALPKMRSYAHRIILADEAGLLTPFPRQEKRVTVLLLQKGKVKAIRYWDPEAEDLALILPAKL